MSTSPWKARAVSVTCAALLLSLSHGAQAYCQTTTCDPDIPCHVSPEQCCVYDFKNCDINGRTVHWPQTCVTYSVQADGSERVGIGSDELSGVLDVAFDQWLSVDCAGLGLSLAAENRGLAQCGSPEFNSKKYANANIWMFQDDPEKTNNVSKDGLGIDASSLAVSVVTIFPSSGDLIDVDVEFNSAAVDFVIGPATTPDEIDLRAVATHEAGHFLGLDHSYYMPSTMYAYYHGEQGSLDPDDMAGICAAYPADRAIGAKDRTCEPYGGYSTECADAQGCSCRTVGHVRQPGGRLASLSLAALGLVLWARRRNVNAHRALEPATPPSE